MLSFVGAEAARESDGLMCMRVYIIVDAAAAAAAAADVADVQVRSQVNLLRNLELWRSHPT